MDPGSSGYLVSTRAGEVESENKSQGSRGNLASLGSRQK
jgi:hypothetical protein